MAHKRARLLTGTLLGAALLSVSVTAEVVVPALDFERASAILDGREAGNREAALASLSTLGDDGHVAAAMHLARAFYLGRGVPRSVAKAATWWQRAARLGHHRAAYNAGLLLLREQPRSEQALAWLRLAADDGDALACFVLGTALAEIAAPGDAGDARRYLESAAASAYAPAQFNLAQVLMRSDDAADRERARHWLEAAASSFAPARAALDAPAPSAAAPSSRTTRSMPHERAWVLEQPPQHFTIQVAAGRSEAGIKALLARHLEDHDAAWFEHRPGAREPYSAVVGSYADIADAQATLATLPQALLANAPWIRRFGTLQRELAEATAARAPAAP